MILIPHLSVEVILIPHEFCKVPWVPDGALEVTLVLHGSVQVTLVPQDFVKEGGDSQDPKDLDKVPRESVKVLGVHFDFNEVIWFPYVKVILAPADSNEKIKVLHGTYVGNWVPKYYV